MPSELRKIYEKYPDRGWNYMYLLENVTFIKDIADIEEMDINDKDWKYLSYNDNFTIEWVDKYPDKPWDFDRLSNNFFNNSKKLSRFDLLKGLEICFMSYKQGGFYKQFALQTNIEYLDITTIKNTKSYINVCYIYQIINMKIYKSTDMCVLCFDDSFTPVIFFPCGHISTCTSCLEKNNLSKCLLCKSDIQKYLKYKDYLRIKTLYTKCIK